MQVQLGGKVAIVTGASRGIGRAVVTMLAAEGAHVVAVARSEAMLAELVAALPVPDLAVVADLRQEGAAQRVVEAALQAFARLDIVVNSAGATVRRDFLVLDDADWHDGFALKFFAAIPATLQDTCSPR